MRPLPKTAANLDNTRVQGFAVIRRVVPYLWPEGQGWVKRRVVAALLILLLAKVIAVGTPIFYKQAVDALAPETASAATFLGFGAVGLTLAYGLARLMNVGLFRMQISKA